MAAKGCEALGITVLSRRGGVRIDSGRALNKAANSTAFTFIPLHAERARGPDAALASAAQGLGAV